MTRRHVALVLLGALFAAGLPTGTARADESPILNRPLPVFELAHALQGDAWSHADLRGSVVVLDLFQVG